MTIYCTGYETAHCSMALRRLICHQLPLRAADQLQLVLMLPKVRDAVPLQHQHLGYKQPQLSIAYHSHPVSRSQHLYSACCAHSMDRQEHLLIDLVKELSAKARKAGRH